MLGTVLGTGDTTENKEIGCGFGQNGPIFKFCSCHLYFLMDGRSSSLPRFPQDYLDRCHAVFLSMSKSDYF